MANAGFMKRTVKSHQPPILVNTFLCVPRGCNSDIGHMGTVWVGYFISRTIYSRFVELYCDEEFSEN